MAEIKDYSTTAGNNNSASPNGMPENMAPSGVNDSWREGMARIKRWYDDISAVNSLAGGTTAYTLAASRTISAYAAGDVFLAVCNATNTGASTLNVDSVGAKSIVDTSNTALLAGQLIEDGIYQFAYDANNDKFVCLNPSNAGALVVIASGTVSAAATLDITGLTTTYRAYILTFSNLLPVTDNVDLMLRVSTDGGSSYKDGANVYAWGFMSAPETASVGGQGDGADTSIVLTTNCGNVGGEQLVGEILIPNPAGGDRTQIIHRLSRQTQAPIYQAIFGGGQYQATTATNAIRLMFSSGNISTMSYTLTGIRA